MRIGILGVSFLGLLDSGATRKMLSAAGWQWLADMNLPLEATNRKISVVNGSVARAIGCGTVPITVQDKFHWASNQGGSFKAVKELLASAPILACPNFDRLCYKPMLRVRELVRSFRRRLTKVNVP